MADFITAVLSLTHDGVLFEAGNSHNFEGKMKLINRTTNSDRNYDKQAGQIVKVVKTIIQ